MAVGCSGPIPLTRPNQLGSRNPHRVWRSFLHDSVVMYDTLSHPLMELPGGLLVVSVLHLCGCLGAVRGPRSQHPVGDAAGLASSSTIHQSGGMIRSFGRCTSRGWFLSLLMEVFTHLQWIHQRAVQTSRESFPTLAQQPWFIDHLIHWQRSIPNQKGSMDTSLYEPTWTLKAIGYIPPLGRKQVAG